MWKGLLRETRTQIFLMYALLLFLLSGIAIPIFRHLLFDSISRRVEEGLNEEQDAFFEAHQAWESDSNQQVEALERFVDQYLQNNRPEDDNFQIVLVDNGLHKSNPSFLLEPLRPGTDLFERWQKVTEFSRGEVSVDSPQIGSILYRANPIMLGGEQRGVFVVAHSTAGERQEALVGVYLFVWFLLAVIGISLLFSWLGAGRLLAPLATLAKTSKEIGESDLTQRIAPAKNEGDLADLTNTFNAMMDRIQAAFDSQRDFINDAGHELRTPITIIQGHLELLDDDPQERQETVELVLDELGRMGRLVNDMILLAKSERPQFLQPETIEMASFAEAIFAKATALAERDWQLKVEGEGELVGDYQKLTGAFINLLKNATQHTDAADVIELGCRRSDSDAQSWVEFWVRDTGEGIESHEQERIFARFARGQQRRSDGSGLGLAIVRSVIEAHGGRVELVSQPGVGSTFRLILPVTGPPSAFERHSAAL